MSHVSDVRRSTKPASAHFVPVSHDDIRKDFDFRKATCIGKGACGEVYVVPKQGTKDLFAVKALEPRDKEERKELLQEVAVQRILDHPNMVKVYSACDNPDDDLLYIVMELWYARPHDPPLCLHAHSISRDVVAARADRSTRRASTTRTASPSTRRRRS